MSRRRALQPNQAITEAAWWRVLGLLFERPRPGWREELDALAGEVADAELQAAVAAARPATEGAYLALLGPGGPVSPREVSYRGMDDPGWLLADVSRFYQAFAYRPRSEDPIDHVAVETGFVGYLFLKEALARAGGDDDAARAVARARTQFLAEHLATMAGPLVERVAAVGGIHLLAAATLLAARVPPSAVARAPGSAADVPDGCGSCGVD